MFHSVSRMILMVPVLVIAALAQQKQADAKQEESKGLERLTRAERFQGALTAKAKDGKAVPVQVALRTWSVRAGPGALRLPDQGFLVIQLHSGKLKTTMDGKQQERHEGEFWVVPVGAQMSIEVVSETAVLQTATFGKP